MGFLRERYGPVQLSRKVHRRSGSRVRGAFRRAAGVARAARRHPQRNVPTREHVMVCTVVSLADVGRLSLGQHNAPPEAKDAGSLFRL